MPTRRTALAVLVPMLLVLAGLPARAQQDDIASRLILQLGADVIDQLNAPKADRAATIARFKGVLEKGFDIAYIGRFVLGRYWNLATPQQQQEYLSLFEEMIVNVYADRFRDYVGHGLSVEKTIRILGSHPDGDHDTLVASQILRPDGPPINVEWRVRSRDSGSRIIDVAVEGVSMSVSQRQEFASVIQRGGGQMQVLLADLKAKIADEK